MSTTTADPSPAVPDMDAHTAYAILSDIDVDLLTLDECDAIDTVQFYAREYERIKPALDALTAAGKPVAKEVEYQQGTRSFYSLEAVEMDRLLAAITNLTATAAAPGAADANQVHGDRA